MLAVHDFIIVQHITCGAMGYSVGKLQVASHIRLAVWAPKSFVFAVLKSTLDKEVGLHVQYTQRQPKENICPEGRGRKAAGAGIERYSGTQSTALARKGHAAHFRAQSDEHDSRARIKLSDLRSYGNRKMDHAW